MENTLPYLKEALARSLDSPVREVCQALLDRLADLKLAQAKRLTYFILGKFVDRAPDDNVLHSAVAALTTIRHHPLTMYFVFYDEEEDREIALPASEVMQSVDEGLFIHPRTGEQVNDFQLKIRPVFCISEEFAQAVTRDVN